MPRSIGLAGRESLKRGAIFGVLLPEEVLEDVGHVLWTFTIPRMLRPYFLHHRELLGELCRAGWEVVRQLMVAATQRSDLQPGLVSVVHTAGDVLGWHPHVHAITSRGGWNPDGEWVPVPFVGTREAERLGRYLLRSPVAVERLALEPRTGEVLSGFLALCCYLDAGRPT